MLITVCIAGGIAIVIQHFGLHCLRSTDPVEVQRGHRILYNVLILFIVAYALFGYHISETSVKESEERIQQYITKEVNRVLEARQKD